MEELPTASELVTRGVNRKLGIGMITRAWMRLRNVAGFSVLAIAACAVSFVVIEGASSAVLFLYDGFVPPSGLFPSNYVTRYDELLGWTNAPDSRVEGTFGPGTHVTINSQSFRGESNFSLKVPSGKVRIVCSGDSFTFGSEVSDQDTWCNQLTRIDPRLETINMGKGGVRRRPVVSSLRTRWAPLRARHPSIRIHYGRFQANAE